MLAIKIAIRSKNAKSPDNKGTLLVIRANEVAATQLSGYRHIFAPLYDIFRLTCKSLIGTHGPYRIIGVARRWEISQCLPVVGPCLLLLWREWRVRHLRPVTGCQQPVSFKAYRHWVTNPLLYLWVPPCITTWLRWHIPKLATLDILFPRHSRGVQHNTHTIARQRLRGCTPPRRQNHAGSQIKGVKVSAHHRCIPCISTAVAPIYLPRPTVPHSIGGKSTVTSTQLV